MEKSEDTDKKLNMSLDALIKNRKKTGTAKSKEKPAKPQQAHNRQQNQDGPQQGVSNDRQPRNGDFQGRQQAFTNSGLMMPNFGMPFGHPNQLSMHMMGMGGMNGAHPPLPGMPFPPNMLPPSGLNPHALPFIPPVEQQQNIAVPQARVEKVSGEVRVSFRKQDIVRISKDGTISIETKGVHGPAMFMALNAILKVVDVSITRAKNAKPEDEWSVSDGRSLTRFRDGMTVPGRGYEARLRGKKVMDSFGKVDPSAAAAATAASNAAARAAGIYPKPADPSRNAGIHPVGGRPLARQMYRPPGSYERRPNDDGANGTESHEGQGSGGKSQAEQDRVRRLAAKGRYRPY